MKVEVREARPGGPIELRGWAATFNEPYSVQGFTENIEPGAFKRTLAAKPDVVLLINHEGLPLARTRSGTLTLAEDSRGLLVRAKLDRADPDVASLIPKMKRGDLTEMSFAFKATDESWSSDQSKRTLRAVSVDGGDVSLVTRGANPMTSASLRRKELTMEQRSHVARSVGRTVIGPSSPLQRRAFIAGRTAADELMIVRAYAALDQAYADRGHSRAFIASKQAARRRARR